MKDRWLLALGIVAWFLLYGVILAPPLGETDTYFFKDAGANLALGHGFVSLATFGNPTLAPKLYAHYPPLQGLAYAGFSALFGVGPRENMLFNLTVAAVTTLLAFLALRRLADPEGLRFYRPMLCLLTIAALPMAFSGVAGDRPDALGLAASIATLLALSASPSLARYFFASILAGIALEISPISAALTVAAVAAFWISRSMAAVDQPVSLWCLTPVSLLGFLLCPVLVTSVMLWLDPSWLERFRSVSTGEGVPTGTMVGGGVLIALLHGHVGRFLDAYEIVQPAHAVYYVSLLAVWLAVIGYTLWYTVSTRSSRALWPSLLIIAVGALPLLLVPYQSRYAGIASGISLILFSVIVAPHGAVQRKAAQLAIIVGFFGMVATNAPFLARDLVYQAYLGPSLARMTATIDRLKQQGVFQDKIVAVSPDLYMLFKESGLNIVNWYSPAFFDPALRRKVTFYAFAYEGTRDPLRPWHPDWWNADHFTPIFVPQLPQQVSFLGLRSNSSITWEAALYERRGAE